MTLEAIPYILVLGTLFGSTLLAGRFSVDQFQPMTYVGMRLVLAGIIHALIYLVTGAKRPWPRGRGIWWKAAILALFGTAVPMNLLTFSLLYQSSGVTAILITLSPAFTVVLAHFFLDDEPLTSRKGIGVLLALSGAVLMLALGETGLPDVTEANPIGYLLVFISMISSSSTTIFARKNMQGCDLLDVASIRMWVAGLVVMPLSLVLVGFDLSRVT
ncbi:MAG: DMT family transporter, partial [Anaerolineales bacterium]